MNGINKFLNALILIVFTILMIAVMWLSFQNGRIEKQKQKLQLQIQSQNKVIEMYKDSLKNCEDIEINQTINNYNAQKIKQVIKK